MKIRIVLALSALLLTGCGGKEKSSMEDSLVILQNDHVKVGVLAGVGGRVVWLSKPGMGNVLKADPALWNEPESERPKPSPTAEFKTYNGHIVWVGPQSGWWLQQDVNQKRLQEKAVWPPDPYLIYGNFEIVEQRADYVKLTGPQSPVSGLQLTKEITLDENGKVIFKVTAENIRDEAVTWDLWMNTRMDAFDPFYVPADSSGLEWMGMQENERQDVTPYEFVDGYFTFNPSDPESGKAMQVQKAYLTPNKPYLAAFCNNQMFIIHFKEIGKDRIHPEHTLTEIYNVVRKGRSETLLELEVHGAYTTLQPGERMSLQEEWDVYMYEGGDTHQNRIDALKQVITE